MDAIRRLLGHVKKAQSYKSGDERVSVKIVYAHGLEDALLNPYEADEDGEVGDPGPNAEHIAISGREEAAFHQSNVFLYGLEVGSVQVQFLKHEDGDFHLEISGRPKPVKVFCFKHFAGGDRKYFDGDPAFADARQKLGFSFEEPKVA